MSSYLFQSANTRDDACMTRLSLQNPTIPTMTTIPKMAGLIRSSVIKWNAELSCDRVGRAKEWKQLLKNNFVHFTQFAIADPSKQKQQWRQDLMKAATQTIAATCPEWAIKPADREKYDLILRETQRTTSPRQEWLRERARTWLLSMPPQLQMSTWYPNYAIPVAHQLFLGDSDKFQAFIEYLRRRKNPIILHLIQAHETMIAAKMGNLLVLSW